MAVGGLVDQGNCRQDFTQPGGGSKPYQKCRDDAFVKIIVGIACGGAFLLFCFISCCAFMDCCCFRACKRQEARRGYRTPKYTPRTPKPAQFPAVKYDTVGDAHAPAPQLYAPFAASVVQPAQAPLSATAANGKGGLVMLHKQPPQDIKTFALSPMQLAPPEAAPTEFRTSHSPQPLNQPANAPPTLSDIMQKSPGAQRRSLSQNANGAAHAEVPGGARHAENAHHLTVATGYLPEQHHVVNVHTHHDGQLRSPYPPSAGGHSPMQHQQRSTEPRTSNAPPPIPARPYSSTEPGAPRDK
jgi:hypothetical protein